jgi:hypothetical protein
LDEGHGIDGALEIGSEGEQDMNVLAWDTSAQRSSVDLVVSGFDIVHILSEEMETDFGPWGVFPLGSDHEWDDAVTVGSDWLDGEKLVGAVLTGEVENGWNKRKSYKLQFRVYFWIRFLKYGYSREYRLLWLNLKLHSMILWGDLSYCRQIPCWMRPL